MAKSKIIQPAFLKQGDKVALISPAYWLPKEAIEEAAKQIRKWGLTPIIGPHTNEQESQAYAGDADRRAEDLKWALEDDDIKAVICCRGGYGSLHLLNRIAPACYLENPKWLVGYGDITALLCAQVKAGVMAIHGPMGLQLAARQSFDVRMLRDLLFGTIPQYDVKGHPNNIAGKAQGILLGGNLSTFTSVSCTGFTPTDRDIILFIEESEESLHHIDRLFYMLNLYDKRKQIKGVILGEFNSLKHDLANDSVENMLVQHLHGLDIPVCCGFPVGTNHCPPLIVGAEVTLDVNEQTASLTFHMEGKKQLDHIDNTRCLMTE